MRFCSFVAFCLSFSICFAGELPQVEDVLDMELSSAQAELKAIQAFSDSSPIQQEKLARAKSNVAFLSERNALLQSRVLTSSIYYHVYAAEAQTAFRYLNDANGVFNRFHSLFPEYQFSKEHPAHFVIYPDRASYRKYENIKEGIAGHAVSDHLMTQRYIETERGLELEEQVQPQTQLQRLAFYVPTSDDPNQVTFAHELTHLFTWDLIQKSKTTPGDIDLNLFLNEGFAEYMAVMDHDEQKKLRLEPLRHIKDPQGPLVWVGQQTYPGSERIREFYSEAYLFTRWIMETDPHAALRLRMLLQIHSAAQAIDTMDVMQKQKGIPVLNFDAYNVWRAKVLGRSNLP